MRTIGPRLRGTRPPTARVRGEDDAEKGRECTRLIPAYPANRSEPFSRPSDSAALASLREPLYGPGVLPIAEPQRQPDSGGPGEPGEEGRAAHAGAGGRVSRRA